MLVRLTWFARQPTGHDSGLALCVLVVLLYGILRGHWLNGVLAAITLAMSVLPEEFPIVLTIFLALGAWRLAQRGARPGTNGCSGRA